MWQLVVTWVITAVLAYALAPKPKGSSAPPTNLEEFKAPVAEEGREIPVLFGTRKLTQPNVVWYGHLDTSPIVKCEDYK
jgi:hypothetical protein